MWAGLAVGGGLILAGLLVLVVYLYKGGLAGKLRILTVRQRRLASRKGHQAARKKLVTEIYDVLQKSLQAEQLVFTYQAVDLLKLALGEKVCGSNTLETLRLSACIITALQKKQFDAAGQIADAYSPLVRRLATTEMARVFEQMGFVSVLALKARQNFIAAKIVDFIFVILIMLEWDSEAGRNVVKTVLRTLKIIGVMAIRRQDTALLHELNAKLRKWLQLIPPEYQRSVCTEIAAVLMVNWLHRVIRADDLNAFNLLFETIEEFTSAGIFNEGIGVLAVEWRELAGEASLRPDSLLALAMPEKVLQLVLRTENKDRWLLAVRGCMQNFILVVGRKGLREAFPLLEPVLTTGRRLLTTELNFAVQRETTVFVQRALQALVQECLLLAEYLARQDMTSTGSDIIEEFFSLWTREEKSSSKSKKKFCQLLLLFWLQRRRRQARRVELFSPALALPMLLSIAEQKKLGLSEGKASFNMQPLSAIDSGNKPLQFAVVPAVQT